MTCQPFEMSPKKPSAKARFPGWLRRIQLRVYFVWFETKMEKKCFAGVFLRAKLRPGGEMRLERMSHALITNTLITLKRKKKKNNNDFLASRIQFPNEPRGRREHSCPCESVTRNRDDGTFALPTAHLGPIGAGGGGALFFFFFFLHTERHSALSNNRP